MQIWKLGNWFSRETGLADKLVLQGNWFSSETSLAGKLVFQGNIFCGEINYFSKHFNKILIK